VFLFPSPSTRATHPLEEKFCLFVCLFVCLCAFLRLIARVIEEEEGWQAEMGLLWIWPHFNGP
jgi:hypothetical protein